MRFPLVAFVICLTVGPAKAEFVMLSQPGAPDGAAGAWPQPIIPRKPKTPQKRHLALPSEPLLAGFGDNVPLNFAVRQIVPARYHVAFGETVDREAAVDWKGGRPWRATLTDTVRPLGLVVSVTGPTVRIGAPTSAR